MKENTKTSVWLLKLIRSFKSPEPAARAAAMKIKILATDKHGRTRTNTIFSSSQGSGSEALMNKCNV
jgi:hypothetical protein